MTILKREWILWEAIRMNRETLPTEEKMRRAADKNAADRNTYEDENRKTTQEDQKTRIRRKEWLIQEAKKFNLLT